MNSRSLVAALLGTTLTAALVALAVAAGSSTLLAATAPPAAAPIDPAGKLLLKANGNFSRNYWDLAAQDYQAFLQQFPNHAEATNARFALAVCEFYQQQYDPAIELLGRVLQDGRFMQLDEALAVLANAQLQAGRYDKALAAADQLLKEFPRSKNAELASLYRVQALYLDRKYPNAIAAAQRMIEQFPASERRSTALYFEALAEVAQGQHPQAEATLQRLLTVFRGSPHEIDAMLLLGQTLEAEGKLDAAAEQYRRMIAAAPAPRAGEGHYSLGVLLARQEKYDEAIRELSQVTGDTPSAKAAKLQLGITQLAAGHNDDARRTLAAVAKEDASHATEARYGLAQVDMAQKKWDAARAALEQLEKLQPAPKNLAQIVLDHAVCLIELNQHDAYETAARELADFTQRFPNSAQDPEAVYRRAFALHKLGQYDQSHAVAEPIARGKSSFAAAAAELDAENLFLGGKYPDAAKAYSALMAASNDADRRMRYTFRLGQCAYFEGNYARAVELLAPVASNPSAASDETLGRAAFLMGDALLQQQKYAEAADALQKYLLRKKRDRSNFQEAQVKLALAQLQLKQPDEARKNLKAAADGPRESEWTARALLELGQLAYQHDPPQLDEASAFLKRVLSGKPPAQVAIGATYLLGWIDFQSKRWTDAAAKWEQVITKNPKDPLAADAMFWRGVALKEAGQEEPALAALQKYVQDNPGRPHVAVAKQRIASVLSTLHRDDEAKQMLELLAANKSTATDGVLYDLAWAQKATKDLTAAKETYQHLLTDHADSRLAPAARTELAELLYEEKKYDQSLDLLKQVLDDKSADPKSVAAVRYRIGWCYKGLNLPEQAAAAFADYAKQMGGRDLSGAEADRMASATLQSGLAYASAGKLEPAATALKQFLEKFPRHKDAPVAMLKLGEVQADAGDFNAALATDRDFLKQFPDDPYAYRARFGAGWALENLKYYADARDEYAKVIAASNGETAARAQFQTGETFLEEGKFEPAVGALLAVEDVYAFPKWSARALYEAGRAFEQLKQRDRAKQQYALVMQKYKDAPEAELAQDRLKAMK